MQKLYKRGVAYRSNSQHRHSQRAIFVGERGLLHSRDAAQERLVIVQRRGDDARLAELAEPVLLVASGQPGWRRGGSVCVQPGAGGAYVCEIGAPR